MGFDIRFRQVETYRDISRLIDFISEQPLNYKGYKDWVARTEAEILQEYKQAILISFNDSLVGDIIYQPHKQIKGFLEIKNVRVAEIVRERDLGHCALKQVEKEARDSGKYKALIVDARADQRDVLGLLNFSGYFPITSISLYDTNERDIVMVKPIIREDSKENASIQIARSFFSV